MSTLRDQFPAYYEPSDNDREDMFKNWLFSLDAVVLLHLYRYSPETREVLLDRLRNLGERLWITHQAGVEYQRNREKTILEQVRRCRIARESLEDARKEMQTWHGNERSAPFLSEELRSDLEASLSRASADVTAQERRLEALLVKDEIRESLDSVVGQRVLGGDSADEVPAIYKEGKQRYDAKTPPGYLDTGKGHPRMYGDFILWRQIIALAREKGQPVVLVTDDQKEDWWHRSGDRLFGPRRELVEELEEKAGQGFFLMTPSEFLKLASKLDSEVSKEALEEVESVSQERAGDAASMARRITGLDSILTLQDRLRKMTEAPAAVKKMFADQERLRKAIEPSLAMQKLFADQEWLRKAMMPSLAVQKIVEDQERVRRMIESAFGIRKILEDQEEVRRAIGATPAAPGDALEDDDDTNAAEDPDENKTPEGGEE